MNDNAVTIRRARISNFISENHNIDKKNFKTISDELDIAYETVRKDIDWLNREDEKIYQTYNLEGLRKKALDKIIQFEKMIEKIDNDILTKDNIDPDLLLKASTVKSQLLNDLHQLEHNGVGIINQRMKGDKNKMGN